MPYYEPPIKSFYRGKTFGESLYYEILRHKPKRVIEFGNGLGFTTAVIASALDYNERGHIISYDNSLNLRKWLRLCWNIGLHPRVSIRYGDLHRWLDQPAPFDLLYVDVNNTGEIIAKLTALKGIVIFEGGSKARDEHARGKPPIQGSAPYKILDPTFPSLSRLHK